MELTIIVAVSKNGVIGNNGKMPWHSKEELIFFRGTTLGNPVIMGRKTFESLDKPLKGRENIILSKDNNLKVPQECNRFSSVGLALEYCKKQKYEKCFIIGGREIFEQTISLADSLIISEMNFESGGNVFFSKIDRNKWNLEEIKSYNDFNVNYYTRAAIQS